MDFSFDAILVEWEILTVLRGGLFFHALSGQIMGDRRERFPDGRRIMTSPIISHAEEIVPGQVVHTLNTRYLLGARADGGNAPEQSHASRHH